MNAKQSKLWWAFLGGVLLVVAALSWASMTVYSLEQRNAVVRAENQRQELIRLALWRMDSRLAPMIALEAARPIEDYETVFDAKDRSYNYMESAKQSEPALFNLGYFEIDEIGQAKGSDDRAREIAGLTQTLDEAGPADTTVGFSSPRLRSQQQSTASDSEMLIASDEMVASSPRQAEGDFEARQQIANIAQSNLSLSKLVAEQQSEDQRSKKSELIEFADSALTDSGRADDSAGSGSSPFSGSSQPPAPQAEEFSFTEVERIASEIGAIEPRWVAGDGGEFELVLMRTIVRDGESVVQGVWLDWDAMVVELIGSISDLLPTSTLTPITGDQSRPDIGSQRPSYRLATVPVAFNPGGSVALAGDSFTPAMIAMLVTWISVIIAMVAVGMVLRTVLTLSARRAHFVGAVTHELRTPLTTFRLYSQMLADGMVTDEAVRKEYLNTLKRESDRLTGIVENVLEYARISRSRHGKAKPKGEQQLSVGELMARIVPPMSRLGEQSGMDLIVSDETSNHADRTVTLDPHAIERIVMNLMDNACKYAGVDTESDQESDLRVHLDSSVAGDSLLLVVADHGPGVASRDRRKIFGEFIRGSSPALRDRSGLGLGLALSRGLAVEMGGDLSLVRKRGHGAEFELRIPLDDE